MGDCAPWAGYSYCINRIGPMTFRIAAVLTTTGQQLGNGGEDTYATRQEAQLHADFYNEQVADEDYRYIVTAA